MSNEQEFFGKPLGDQRSEEQKEKDRRAVDGEYLEWAENFIKEILPKKGETMARMPADLNNAGHSLNVAMDNLDKLNCEELFGLSKEEVKTFLYQVAPYINIDQED